ncbi:hypothetical protein EYF80_036508 [Liparis tanakae]|uniref:Uncharacterized protein n=1 Tax=Liparis tanakae TaxID=230148 RepID=A0A4Z2GKH1_9TELE|nr:hypothetical protein EYF80_036508 [Liparis tanakae]
MVRPTRVIQCYIPQAPQGAKGPGADVAVAVKSVNLSTLPSLRGRRGLVYAACCIAPDKVSRGLGREHATRSVAADGEGGTKSGGRRWVSWSPGGDDVGSVGQEMGLLHMEFGTSLGHVLVLPPSRETFVSVPAARSSSVLSPLPLGNLSRSCCTVLNRWSGISTELPRRVQRLGSRPCDKTGDPETSGLVTVG